MAYTLISPPTKAPSQVAWQILPLTTKFSSPISDDYQTASWGPGLWIAGVTFSGLLDDDQDDVGAWLDRLADGGYRTKWYDFSRPNPRGVGTGAPVYVDNWCKDPTFTSGTNWALGAGWAVASNKATATAAAVGQVCQSTMVNNAQLIQGVQYEVTYTVSGYGGGYVRPTSSGTGAITGTPVNANGTYTDTFTAGSTRQLIFAPTTSAFTGSISNVTLRAKDMHYMLTKGWTINTADIMKTRDWISVLTGVNLNSELKRLIAASASDANGYSVLQFTPILRNYPADGAAITVNEAYAYFHLSKGAPTTIDLPNVVNGLTIQLTEDPNAV